MVSSSTIVKFAAIVIICSVSVLVILSKREVIISIPQTVRYNNNNNNNNNMLTTSVDDTTIADTIPDAPVHEFNGRRTITAVTLWNYLFSVVSRQRDLFYKDFADFPFPPHLTLDDLTMSTGGNPIRSIILTTWKGGSTFLGDLMNTFQGTFYHSEPLSRYGMVQIRGPPLSESAIRHLTHLLKCNYSFIKESIAYDERDEEVYKKNFRLWNILWDNPQFRRNETFFSEMCKLFPFQTMKLLRLRLRFAGQLLADTSLNVRILLIVRDPRAIMWSRTKLESCQNAPDCSQHELVCIDMVSDYDAAVELKRQYPDRLMVVRYEELAIRPKKYVREILYFFGLHFHRDVIQYLEQHKKDGKFGISSTTPFHWRVTRSLRFIQRIEKDCQDAMKVWGYKATKNDTKMFKFVPIGHYKLR